VVGIEIKKDSQLNEADTCRKYVIPRLIQAGWDTDPHSFTEQRNFTDGRIIVVGDKPKRRIVAYLDNLQSKLDALQHHQAVTAAELDALLPAVLERAFRGEL
jgi:type I site-specific restriction endonuclease